MFRGSLTRGIHLLPLNGRLALLCGLAALLFATLIRQAIDDVVSGCEYTPYLPFVLVSAFLLRWWQAAIVAVGSAAVLGLMFMGPPAELVASHCFISSSQIFLAASAGMILLAGIIRRSLRSAHVPGADESAGGIVFSLEDGEVWASWYGQGHPVLLGSEPKVAEMMEDFLAQVEVGKRLNQPQAPRVKERA